MRAWTIVGFLRLAMLLAAWFAAPMAEAQVVPAQGALPPSPVRQLPPPPVPPSPPMRAFPPAPPGPPAPTRVYVPGELLPDDAKGVPGNVQVQITIAVSGAITACKVSRGVNRALDRASCPFLRKRVWPVVPLAPVRYKPVEESVLLIWRTPPKTSTAPSFGGAAPVGIYWVRHDDYPPEALQAGEQGNVAIQFAISEAGRVTGCEVTESSGSASLDAVSCRAVRERAAFLAPLDEKGHPKPTTGRMRMNWKIEE
ncbi:energy transducer TonB [Sphingomonas koreensis]